MPPKRLNLHGPRRITATSWVTAEGKHKIRITRHDLSSAKKDSPQCVPSPTRRCSPARAVRDAGGKARAEERQRLGEKEKRVEREQTEASGSTSGVVPENIPIRTKGLPPDLMEEAMKNMYPADWCKRIASKGVVKSIETVGKDGFTQYGRLLTKKGREAPIVVK